MPDLLIRNLAAHTIEFFKQRARQKGISLQAEVQALLEDEERRAHAETEAWLTKARALRERVATDGSYRGDSAVEIREDRDAGWGRHVDDRS